MKAFLHAGVLSEDGVTRDTKTGTPQGGILSPLLANIALSVLDEHFAGAWERNMATRLSGNDADVMEKPRTESCGTRMTS